MKDNAYALVTYMSSRRRLNCDGSLNTLHFNSQGRKIVGAAGPGEVKLMIDSGIIRKEAEDPAACDFCGKTAKHKVQAVHKEHAALNGVFLFCDACQYGKLTKSVDVLKTERIENG